jgi:hydrophobic/amphiphilic exporter-1 (mainly G- bacteria), HAE1 family
VYARLVDRKQRQRNVDQMSEPLREQLRSIPGITVTHVGLLDGVSGQKPLSLSIQGPDLQELQRLSDQLMAEMAKIPGLIDLDSSLKTSKPTLSVQVDRQAAADAGLGVGQITAHLRALLEGETVGQWRSGAEQVHDIRLSLAPEDRARPEQLGQLRLQAGQLADGSSKTVRLDQIADIRATVGAQQINRRDMNREVELSANTVGRSLGEVSAEVKKVLAQIPLPAGYNARLGGSTKDMQDSFGYALSALAMAVIFIYMILASQFRSFIQPISLMSSLPLTLIGVVLALLAWRSTLNMFSVIGVIMLMGLVTKNAILLVDFANRARADGMDRTQALLEAARVRLRPILMTTLAMVFGMVPLAFALTEGSEQRAPMGQAVIGGVITSSLLTLVVVPVVYVWLDQLSNWFRRRWTPLSTSTAHAGNSQPGA